MSGWETDLAYDVTITESENALNLIVSYALLDPDHIMVKFRALAKIKK